MPGGFCGLYKNTYGAHVEHECNMKRLERAIGIFRKTRKIYRGDTTVYMTMNDESSAEETQ